MSVANTGNLCPCLIFAHNLSANLHFLKSSTSTRVSMFMPLALCGVAAPSDLTTSHDFCTTTPLSLAPLACS